MKNIIETKKYILLLNIYNNIYSDDTKYVILELKNVYF